VKRIIVGAGMSGLIAAYFHKDATVYDMTSGPVRQQSGLHYLHSTKHVDDWVKQLGLETTMVPVQGGISWQGETVAHCKATPEMIAAHLLKTRHLWTTSLAPEVQASLMNRASQNNVPMHRGYPWYTIYNHLLQMMWTHIQWNKQVIGFQDHTIVFKDSPPVYFDQCYLTVPLPHVMQQVLDIDVSGLPAVLVNTYVAYSRTHLQHTWDYVYFPEPDIPFYRVSWPMGRAHLAVMETSSRQPELHPTMTAAYGAMFGEQTTIISTQHTKLGHIVEMPQHRALADEYIDKLYGMGYRPWGRMAEWRHNVRADTLVARMYEKQNGEIPHESI